MCRVGRDAPCPLAGNVWIHTKARQDQRVTKHGDVLDPLPDAGEEEIHGQLGNVPHTNGRDHDGPFSPFHRGI
jgi:hypothetical protein